jgi:hypothetical protein
MTFEKHGPVDYPPGFYSDLGKGDLQPATIDRMLDLLEQPPDLLLKERTPEPVRLVKSTTLTTRQTRRMLRLGMGVFFTSAQVKRLTIDRRMTTTLPGEVARRVWIDEMRGETVISILHPGNRLYEIRIPLDVKMALTRYPV